MPDELLNHVGALIKAGKPEAAAALIEREQEGRAPAAAAPAAPAAEAEIRASAAPAPAPEAKPQIGASEPSPELADRAPSGPQALVGKVPLRTMADIDALSRDEVVERMDEVDDVLLREGAK